MKAIANRVPIGPSDCNRGMYVPMRGVAKDGRPRNFANDHRGVGQSVGACSWSTRVPAMAEPLPMCVS